MSPTTPFRAGGRAGSQLVAVWCINVLCRVGERAGWWPLSETDLWCPPDGGCWLEADRLILLTTLGLDKISTVLSPTMQTSFNTWETLGRLKNPFKSLISFGKHIFKPALHRTPKNIASLGSIITSSIQHFGVGETMQCHLANNKKD